MAPVLRNRVKSASNNVPKSNNTNSDDSDNRKVLLPKNIMTAFKNQVFFIFNLNVNQYKEVKKPLTHGIKVLLPISKAAITNGMLPDYLKQKQNPNPVQDIRDDPTKKAYFLSCLGLVEKKVAEAKEESMKNPPLNLILEKKLRSRKPQVVTFFKNNPLPINSSLGRTILDAGIGKVENPMTSVAKYEAFCSTSNKNQAKSSSSKTSRPRRTRQLKNIRQNQISEDQYCHTYSFGARERWERSFALNVGLNEKSFLLYSKCQDLSVQLSKQDVRKAKAALKVPKVLPTNNGQKRIRLS